MLRLRTFGGLSIDDATAASPPGRVAQRRRLALLAILAAHGHRAVSRDKLLALLWPERRTEEARHSLAQLVYGIRHELGDDAVLSGPDDLRTNPNVLAADVVEFADAVERGDFTTAVDIYKGPFLDGVFLTDAPEFERWVEDERADLARRYATALEGLARVATQHGEHADAIKWWRRRAALDPLDASVTQDLMRALAASEDRPAAIRQAAIHATLLRTELDAPPDANVAALAERIRQQMVAAAPRQTPAPPQPQPQPHVDRQVVTPSPRLPTLPRRRVAIVAGAFAIVAALGAALWQWRRDSIDTPTTPPLIVLGMIDGPDSTLSMAVREGLRSGLELDGSIHVLGEARTRATLALMAQKTDARLTRALATEVAMRNGAALAIVGSAVPLGHGIQIVAQALDPRTGDAAVTVSERTELPDSAVLVIARLGRRLRERAPGAARRRDAPLPLVMTPSLEALQDYALARRALAHSDREGALRFAEAALEQDSLFPMANYLVGDLDWFSDRQRECERHLARALAMKDRLTLRERLLVRARYEQLVADRSDSALAYWQRLHAAYPDDGQAFEGMAWTYRAMGNPREAAIAADSAIRLDSTTFAPSVTNKLFALIDAGDTTGALSYARSLSHDGWWWIDAQARYLTAVRAKDWPRALAAFPDTAPSSRDPRHSPVDPYHHAALLYNGRLAEAARLVPRIRRIWPNHQFAPSAILLQARAELAHGGSPARAAAAAREVLGWVEAADLSAPAVSRLTERVVELSARAGDPVTIAAARRLLDRRDAGRNLPSYRLAMLTADAAAAFTRGDMRSAAAFAEAARQGMFHGRSLAHIALLEADARASLGERDAAAELYRRLLTPDAFAGSHLEVWPLFEQEAERRLRVGGRG